jgi:plastocyanin
MRRTLLAILAVALLAVIVEVASGAVTSGTHRLTSTAAGAGQMPGAQMPMPATASAARVAATVELHRRVVRVKILNFAFVPAHLVVSPGTRIVWTNEDSDPHTVTSDATSGGLSSAALDTGGHYAAVVKRPGTVTYHCTIHPYMHGSVLVRR